MKFKNVPHAMQILAYNSNLNEFFFDSAKVCKSFRRFKILWFFIFILFSIHFVIQKIHSKISDSENMKKNQIIYKYSFNTRNIRWLIFSGRSKILKKYINKKKPQKIEKKKIKFSKNKKRKFVINLIIIGI